MLIKPLPAATFSPDLSEISDRVLDVLIEFLDPQDCLAPDVRMALRNERRRRSLARSGQSAEGPVRMVLLPRGPAENLLGVHELLEKVDGLKAKAEVHRNAAQDLVAAAAFYEQLFNVLKQNGMAALQASQPRTN